MGTFVTRLRGMPDNPAQGMPGGVVSEKHDMSDAAVMRILDAFRIQVTPEGEPIRWETDGEVFIRLGIEWIKRLEREAREIRRRAAADAVQADTVTSTPDV